MQYVLAVKQDDQLQQHTQIPEESVADDSEKQNLIPADDSEPGPEIAEEICPKFPGRIGGGQTRKAAAKGQANHRQADENDAGKDLFLSKRVRKDAGEYLAADGGRKRPQAKYAVAPG